MIDTIAQVVKGLKEKKVKLSEGAILDLATCIWNDSLDLIQEGKEPQDNIAFYIDGDEDLEVG